MKIYLAARYSRHEEMVEVARELQRAGHTVTSRWISGGHDIVRDAHSDEDRARFAIEDLEDVSKSDCVLSFTEDLKAGKGHRPSKGGRHVELGVAIALNLMTAIIGPREHVFHYLPTVEVYDDLETFLASIAEDEAEEE